MANFPFTVGDSLRIGSATISASGNAVVLPTGTQVGNQNVATTVEVSTGGGPKITNLQVTSNVYVVLDDTAVDLTGGFIKITGTNFVSGCMVYVASTPANSTTFVSTTEVRAQLPATAAGTYPVYLVNPDGGTAIRVPGVTFSASPAWQTASSLGEQYDGVVLTLPVVATDATVYTLSSGSLPPGLSLNSNTGVISGTVSGVANDTVYSFTITATDAQLQDSPRTFTVTITVSDPYFKLTTLLLSGSAVSANTVIRDSSTNNFNLTVYGDARASNFTPYGTGWSTYFSSTSGITVSGLTPMGTGDLTIETFVYMTTLSGDQHMIQQGTSTTNVLLSWDSTTQKLRFLLRNDSGSNNFDIYSPSAPVLNQWFHFAGTVQGTTGRMWINGNVVTTGTVSGTRSGSQTFVYMGDNGSGGSRPLTGYLSNTRIVVGTAVYTANFSPTTTNLSSVSGTSLLTNQSNRFINLVGNVAATISQGSPRITSFNPFNITNTGVNGSAYFDGTGDYLSTSANTAFAMGTGDFTVEFWYYPVTYGSSQNIISHQYTTGFAIGTQTSGTEFYIAGSFISTATRPTLGMWNHVVCQRASGTASIYFNGTRVQTGSLTGSATSTTALVIGAAVHNLPNEASNGYLSDIRIVKGSAVYSGVTITPPAAPLSAIANTSLLTCQYDQPHNNHTFQDSSSNQFLITRSGNATQGTFSPFSQTGWSNYLGTSSERLTTSTSNSGFSFGTGDFTVEAWVYVTDTTNCMFFQMSTASTGYNGAVTNSVAAYIGSGATPSRLEIYAANSRYNSSSAVVSATTINQWHHFAIVRASGVTKAYWDGTVVPGLDNITDTFNYSTTYCVIGTVYDNTYALKGYISNFRVVKGRAVYTANFTPPTTAVGTTSGGTNPPQGTECVFLTAQSNRFRDSSSNNIGLTATGSPSIQTFSPFAPTAVYSPVTHGGSVYLDGSSDYLSVSNNGLFGAGDWTIEFWMYAPIGQTDKPILETRNPASGVGTSTGFTMTMITSTEIRVFSGSELLRVTVQYVNTWLHIALSKKSGTSRLYFNGTQVATTTSLGTMSDTSFIIGAGYYGVTSLNAFGQFYMSSLRVLTGTGYDTSTITVPTAPPTAITNTSLLLNFTDSAILDSTGRQVLETLADARTSSVITKFTGGSMLFDGTGDYLTIPSPPGSTLDLKSGDFTIEAWINYSTANSTICAIYRIGDSAVTQYIFTVNSTNKLEFTVYASSNSFNSIASSGNISTNTWTHVAVTRAANTLRLFINGVLDGTTTVTVGDLMTLTGSTKFSVGAWSNLGPPATVQGFFNGYIQDLRITKGYARYTANFTAPTGPARLK